MALLSTRLFKKNIPLIGVILATIIATLFLASAMGSLSMLAFVKSQEDGEDPNISENGNNSIMFSDGIPAEGGDCGNSLVFEVSGNTGARYLRTMVGEVYSDGIWSLSPDYEIYDYYGNQIEHDVVRFTSKVQTEFNVIPIDSMGGSVPVALYTSNLSFTSENPSLSFLPQHNIFFTEDRFTTEYSVFHTGYKFHETLLKNSPLDTNQIYLQIPSNIRNQVTNLAREITTGVPNPYDRIIAIVKFLQTNYVYDKNYTRAPDGWDPIEWFLFEEKRGVCANFNSAFVALMRASGIPSRMVSGYAIKGQAEYQQVFSNQSHAWAEVKFQELGWIEFDATGGGGGICDCIPKDEEKPIDPEDKEEPKPECSIPAEGGSLPHILTLEVYGKTGSSYLRSQVGEVYQGGSWRSLPDSQIIDYDGDSIVPNFDRFSRKGDYTFAVDNVNPWAGFFPTVRHTNWLNFAEEVNIKRLPSQELFFTSDTFEEYYNVYSTHYEYDAELLRNSKLDDCPQSEDYLQLPEGLKQKAVELLKEKNLFGISNTYDRLVAIKEFLQTNYVYDKNYTRAPDGWDPIEWFLFQEKRGVCANFNSAFVALMRASEIPSRMVSGFAVASGAEYQEVYADQAHAWAEVKFQELGWIEFDATGGGDGNCTCICDCFPDEEIQEEEQVATFTEITEVQASAVKGGSFSVKGTVLDEHGAKADGMIVLVHLKENKEDEVGILVGQGQVSGGQFVISCLVPANVSIGDYHVIASAVENQHYLGSDSDPIIKIRSETSIVLSAPEWSIDGRNFEIYGRLEEKENEEPVSFSTVSLRIGSEDLGEIETDQDGFFSTTTSIATVGDYDIVADFKETEYFLASQGETNIEICTITLKLDVPENATRLADTELEATLTAGEHPVSGEPVNIFFSSNLVSSTSSDGEGKVKTKYYVPESQELGQENVKFQLTEYPAEKTENITIFARTSLTVENWEKVDDEKLLLLQGKLENDLEEPIENVYLQLECTSKEFDQSVQSLTNSTGISNFNITELPSSLQEPLNYSILFLGEGYYLNSSISGQIEFDPQTNVQGAFGSPFLLAVPAAVAVLVGGIFFINKRRKKDTVTLDRTESAKSVAAATAKNEKPRTTLEASFPQIVHPFPDVWGVNDDLVVNVTLKHGNDSLKRSIKVRFDNSKEEKMKTDDSGLVSFIRKIEEKGLHSIEAKFEGGDTFSACETARNVKIVDYKEEIVEIFNLLFNAIKGKGVPLTEETTPREFQNLTLEYFSDIDRESLEDFVSVFEIANYSLHSLGRREYEKIYLAYLALQNLSKKEIEVIA